MGTNVKHTQLSVWTVGLECFKTSTIFYFQEFKETLVVEDHDLLHHEIRASPAETPLSACLLASSMEKSKRSDQGLTRVQSDSKTDSAGAICNDTRGSKSEAFFFVGSIPAVAFLSAEAELHGKQRARRLGTHRFCQLCARACRRESEASSSTMLVAPLVVASCCAEILMSKISGYRRLRGLWIPRVSTSSSTPNDLERTLTSAGVAWLHCVQDD